MSDTILGIRRLHKTYEQGGTSLNVLNGINLLVDAGETVALVGPSGSGKSTLLQIAGLLDSATSGDVIINGINAGKAGDGKRTELRRNFIGFVYQFHYLQPEFTALENVVIPQMIAGKGRKEAEAHASGLLGNMGLSDRLEHRPARLSGGEQQRVAIARAMANLPGLILADEPTGNLDPETSDAVFSQMMEEVRSRNMAAIIATHNMDLADRMDRAFELRQGRLLAL